MVSLPLMLARPLAYSLNVSFPPRQIPSSTPQASRAQPLPPLLLETKPNSCSANPPHLNDFARRYDRKSIADWFQACVKEVCILQAQSWRATRLMFSSAGQTRNIAKLWGSVGTQYADAKYAVAL